MKKIKTFFGVLIFTILLSNTAIIAQNRHNQGGAGTDTTPRTTEIDNNIGTTNDGTGNRNNYGQWGLVGLLGLLGLIGSGKRKNVTTYRSNP